MLPTAIKWKLTLTIMCALLTGMALLLTTHPHTAFARIASPVIVTRAFTADANCREKSTFARGDAIHYEVVITNTSGQPIKVVLLGGSIGPTGKAMHTAKTTITLPPDQSYWHVPETIPQDAVSGKYWTIQVVDYNGDNQYEVGGESPFTVR